ncbi:hypothetical protein JCM10213_000247 [Rhodosporidiobolus nylandii]
MPSLLARRALQERNLAEEAGTNLQAWIARQSSATVFTCTVVFAFLCALVVLSLAWETARKCRSSLRNEQPDSWHRLPDGSSVRVSNRGDGPDFLGPMGSLLREGRADRAGQGYGYAPARSGETAEMRGEANVMSGTFSAYDPPLQRHQLVDRGAVQSQQQQQQQYALAQTSPRPHSVGTYESGWSGDTRVQNLEMERKNKEDETATTAPEIGKDEVPPPPVQSPPINSAPPSSHRPAPTLAPSVSRSLNSDATLFPLPNSPRSFTVTATSGEAAFSSPKSAAIPVSSTIGTPPRTGSAPLSHARTMSSGFTPKPLGLAGPGGVGRSSSFGSSVTTPEPPKVDLKRTWSIGTWLPNFGKEEKGEEAVAFVRKADGK